MFRKVFLGLFVLLLGIGWSFFHSSNNNNQRDVEIKNKYEILELFTNETMNFKISTTPLPISSSSVVLKAILSKDREKIPKELEELFGLETVSVQSVRQHFNHKRYLKLKHLCKGEEGKRLCERMVNEGDPEFGMTPLHLAYQSGDLQSIQFLESMGADKEKEDGVGRKPMNMSFSNFVSNSRKWAKAANRLDCEIPTVHVRSPSDFSEIKRLVGEGEPVLMKGILSFLKGGKEMEDITVSELVEEHGDSRVTMGPVPYSDVFKLPHKITTLKDYYIHHVLNASSFPSYIFQKNDQVTLKGLYLLGDLVAKAFPSPQLICPVEFGDTGVDSIHFFLGAKNSGAPFHIHADAANLVVKGSKRWLLYPPLEALYSGKHIFEWLQQDFDSIPNDKKPLECIQQAGDVIYVPFDWSHAILNLEDQTFGYALELLNRREVMWSLPNLFKSC